MFAAERYQRGILVLPHLLIYKHHQLLKVNSVDLSITVIWSVLLISPSRILRGFGVIVGAKVTTFVVGILKNGQIKSIANNAEYSDTQTHTHIQTPPHTHTHIQNWTMT